MMRPLRLPIVTLLVLMGPLAGSAVAHEFVVGKIGKGKIESVTPQIFKTGYGVVECAKASGSVEFTTPKSAVLEVRKLQYAECTGFGVAVSSPAGAYEFGANETITFTKALTFTLETPKCTVVFPTIGNSAREKVAYTNNAGKLRIGLEVTGLTYAGSCGAGGTTGRYEGALEVSLEGGTVEWK